MNDDTPGFSILATLLAGGGAWLAHRSSRTALLVGFLAGVVSAWLGVALELTVVTTLGLFAVAVTVGSQLGQRVPPRSRPVFLTLIVLAGIDLVWVASGGGGFGEGWLAEVANVTVEIGGSVSTIGTLDLVIAAALTAHWLSRGAAVWLALTPGPVGMVFSNVFAAVTGATNLALVPFLFLGWLVTEALERRTAGSRGGPARSPVDEGAG